MPKPITTPTANTDAVEQQSTATPKPAVQARKPRTTAKSKAPVQPEREVVYPDILVNGVVIPRENLKITAKMMEDYLGWEDEDTYAARKVLESPHLTPEQCRFSFKAEKDSEGKVIREAKEIVRTFLKDEHGKRVTLWNNCCNRDWKEHWCRSIAQDILNKQYRFNMETMVISRTAVTTSGQHRGVGLILAVQMWKIDPHWRKIWGDEEPYIESLVAFGGSDDPLTLRTVDNVLPRSDADTISTSGIFDFVGDGKGKLRPSKPGERKALSKSLAVARNELWDRTRVSLTGDNRDTHTGYRTHSTGHSFQDNHPRLVDCVKHVAEENRGYVISDMGLSVGELAAWIYLMGSSKSDGDKYRGVATPADRNEKRLDWTLFDKAQEFVVLLASKDKAVHGPIMQARYPSPGDDVDPKTQKVKKMSGSIFSRGAGGGTDRERACTLFKAWGLFAAGKKITPEALRLEWSLDAGDDNVLVDRTLVNPPTIGGIDEGDPRDGDGSGGGDADDDGMPPTPEEAAARKAAIQVEKVNGGSPGPADESPAAEKARRATVLNGGGKGNTAKMPTARRAPGEVDPPKKPHEFTLRSKPANVRDTTDPVTDPATPNVRTIDEESTGEYTTSAGEEE